ncbi:UvrD-helicase domain-containing protein [Cellvibrio sp.]|uniref:UvrD-helicase domain-containing protein n=1 Tax=Cellvibrio sp. TaxID=1965322 RepID=UPI0039647481
MSSLLRVGDQVIHFKHGDGLIVRLLTEGIVEVQFGKSFKYVQESSLTSKNWLEREQRKNNERKQKESERQKKIAAEDKKRHQRNHVIALLERFSFSTAFSFYQGHCSEWWSTEEYVALESSFKEKQRKILQRDAILIEIRSRFVNDFLGAVPFFKSVSSDLISEQEFESEKLSFVKNWISANTPSRGGMKQLPDDEQIKAIASVNGHIQVIARAGSGKTTTLVNRTFFLLKHCRVKPSEILILAFNKKAALEVRKRLLVLIDASAEAAVNDEVISRVKTSHRRKPIEKDEIEAGAIESVAANLNVTLPHIMTFHALAYAIVHPDESILYDGAESDSQSLSGTFQKVIDDRLRDPLSREEIRELMLAHFREDWDRIVEGRHDFSRDEFLKFRRSLQDESIGGDYVKSSGEKLIADFLFEHDIAYKYENNHSWGGINYRPDFTIFLTAKSGIIIEYFGLKGELDYDEESDRKREYWRTKPHWTLMEFTPKDIASVGPAAFLEKLKFNLEQKGIKCTRLSEDEIWSRVKDRAIDRFTKASVRFVGRCRMDSLTPGELKIRIASYKPISQGEGMFLNILQSLYTAYLNRLSATGELDFNGLMQRAGELVSSGVTNFMRKSGGGDLASLRYICVDEFQDFSDLFYRLLVSIRKFNSRVELFCVGDDWQAINGFAGSDLRFFNHFEKHIGSSRQLYISTNYRSSRSIVDIGNNLMTGLGIPARAHKQVPGMVIISDLDQFEPSNVEKERHSGDIVTPAVLRLIGKALADDMDVVLLCRTNELYWSVNYSNQEAANNRGIQRYLELVRSFFPDGLKERITISTAHKYKGLEKPMVILLDLVARRYPLRHPDWVFSRILGDSPEKKVEEERRLLYVALTRAIDKLVIITEGRSKSPFLAELESKVSLSAINWDEYPARKGATSRLVVKVGNLKGRGGAPTFAIKDLLKASGYKYQSQSWAKGFPEEGFHIEKVKSELWCASADGVDVQVLDEMDVLVARFVIHDRQWGTVFNKLVCSKGSDSSEANG